jgi:heat shock protein HslJ
MDVQRPRMVLVAAALAVAMAAAACGDDGGSTSSTGDGGQQGGSIEGEWVATGATEGGATRALVPGTTIRLRLEDGALTASAGCNTIGAAYTIDRDVLRVDATSTTDMGCDPPRHDQDAWLAGVLTSGPRLTRSDDGLLLRGREVEIAFVDREVAEPDRALVGTTWVVDGYVDGSGPDATASSAAGDAARVVFGANGFVVGDDGCNHFGYGGPAGEEPDGLRYEVHGDRIAFTGAAGSTLMLCPSVDTDRFWAVLSGTVTWTIDASHLTLVAADGRGVTYRAEP